MDQLTSYDEKRAAWILENGFYGIWIGNSLADAKLCGGVKLDNEVILRQVKNHFPLKQELDEKLRQLIADRERTESVTIIYFQPDDWKEGGSYVTVTGQINKIDDCSQKIFLTDGTKIDLGRIVDIK